MKAGGVDLLSKGTVTSGRSIVALAGTYLLVDVLKVQLTGFSLFGIEPSPEQLTASTLWVLILLWVILLVNWVGDFLSHGFWNSAYRTPGVETQFDGGGKIMGQINFVLDGLERFVVTHGRQSNPDYEVETLKAHLENLDKLRQSLVIFNAYAAFYVIGLGLVLPTVFAVAAIMMFLW